MLGHNEPSVSRHTGKSAFAYPICSLPPHELIFGMWRPPPPPPPPLLSQAAFLRVSALWTCPIEAAAIGRGLNHLRLFRQFSPHSRRRMSNCLVGMKCNFSQGCRISRAGLGESLRCPWPNLENHRCASKMKIVQQPFGVLRGQ